MNTLWVSTTLSIAINCDPKRVYDFVSHGANLPKWARTFCRSAQPSSEGWLVETPQGPVTIRLVKHNPFGVVDHEVTPASGPTAYVPMRIVPNGGGSEVLFTLFHLAYSSPAREGGGRGASFSKSRPLKPPPPTAGVGRGSAA